MLVVTLVPKLLSHSYHSHGTTVTLGILQDILFINPLLIIMNTVQIYIFFLIY